MGNIQRLESQCLLIPSDRGSAGGTTIYGPCEYWRHGAARLLVLRSRGLDDTEQVNLAQNPRGQKPGAIYRTIALTNSVLRVNISALTYA